MLDAFFVDIFCLANMKVYSHNGIYVLYNN
ncbi:hypothetical protein MTR67_044057 [Solanum verrucosum]|uniref:Uncharacterized protein n=1 Tax=Solanum verrucosum TaxID=315347 RepID=A0AAF0ZSK4_SOLVR|nr:hypothetical protein MTR67_044057 [Solanum verrucosum]